MKRILQSARSNTRHSSSVRLFRSGAARLFDTIVIFGEADDNTRLRGAFDGQSVTLRDRTSFPLTLKVVLEPRMTFTLSFDQSRFDTDFARRLAGLFKRLLHAMAECAGATAGGAATAAGPGRARTRVVQPDGGSDTGAGVRA
jgi:hypothetical protein